MMVSVLKRSLGDRRKVEVQVMVGSRARCLQVRWLIYGPKWSKLPRKGIRRPEILALSRILGDRVQVYQSSCVASTWEG
nr:hypothetical protein [Tanacetum cinerariifolium]